MLRFLIMLFSCLFLPVTLADVYKWTDEHGRIHYGDRPRVENATTLDINEAPDPDSNIGERRDKQKKLLELIEEERNEKEQQQQQAEKEEKKRKINCAKAQKEYESLKTASGVYQKNDKGEPIFMSYEERAAAEEQTRKKVAYWCK